MIDLIIPTYNNSDTLARALGSIVAQTKSKKVIVTIVDDSSTEDISSIIDTFKKLIPIRYIRNEKNLGKPGLVRQIGIDNTNCPYIMFMDADDILAPNAVEVLSRAVLQKQYEYINSAFYQDESQDHLNIIETNQITWLHGNIYSRKFLTENNIRFDDKMNEDGSFNLKCYWLSNNKGKVDQPLYYWMNNKNSLTRKAPNFLVGIAYDYIATYADAFKFIVKSKPELTKNKRLIKDIAAKLAQFFEFIDAYIYYNNDLPQNIIDKLTEFIDFCEWTFGFSTSFLKTVHFYYNRSEIFPNAIRQHTLTDYFEMFKIYADSEDKKNENNSN